jgi:hypothetical protein
MGADGRDKLLRLPDWQKPKFSFGVASSLTVTAHLNPAHFRGILGEGQMPSRLRGNLSPAYGLRLLSAGLFVCLPA